MKRFALTIMAAAALVLAASCQKENVGAAGENATVAFNIGIADVQTRSTLADGTKANQLRFEVYDQDGDEIEALRQTVAIRTKKATISTTLAKGKTYTFAFFAYKNGQTVYDLNGGLKSVSVKYDEGTIAGNEDRDAFAASKEITVTDNFTESITLKRPFAQVNVLISDAAEALTAAGVDTKAKVAFTGYSTEYNVLTGTAKEPEAGALEYTAETAMTSDGEGLTIAGVKYTDAQYLSMAYLLVPAGKSLADINLTINGEEYAVPNAPVQPNYRTNIILSLLTAGKFNVIVDSEFEGDLIPVAEGVAKNEDGDYVISGPEGLTYASYNLFKKGGVFKLSGDIDMTDAEYLAVNLEPNSPAFELDGCGYTISNLKNITSDGDKGIYSGLIGRAGRSADFVVKNLTIKDSEFIGTNNMDGEYSAGAIVGWYEVHTTGLNTAITNCTVTGCTFGPTKYIGGLVGYNSGAAPLNITGCTVENCTFTSAYSEDGVNYKGHCGGFVGLYTTGTINDSGVKNCTFDVKGPRGGQLLGTAQAKAVIGTGNWVSGNTGVEGFLGSLDYRDDNTTNIEVR